MMFGRYKIAAAALAVFLVGCAPSAHQVAYENAQAAFNEGKDDLALKNVLESLKLKPDYKPAMELLTQMYDYAIKTHRDAIKKLKKNGKDASRWDKIVDHEDRIELINKEVELAKRRNREIVLDVKSNEESLKMALDSAAYWNFQYGLEKKDDPSRDSQRLAASYFSRTLDYDKNYPDAEAYYEECRQKGSMRIVVDKFQGDFSRRIDGAVISAMQKDKKASEYLVFLSRDNLDRLLEEQSLSLSGDFIDGSGVDMVGKLLDAQYVIVGNVESAVCAEKPEVETSDRPTRSVRENGKDCEINSKGKRVCRPHYDEFEGVITTDTLRRKASMAGTVKMLDVSTGEIKKSADIRVGVMSTGLTARCHGHPYACADAKLKKEVPLRSCGELGDQLIVEYTKKAVKEISAYTKNLVKKK